jgi:hypothetical protein
MPEVSNQSDNNITVLRDDSILGSAIHFWPTVDGKDIAGLLTNQYISFKLDHGVYKLGVRCFGGWIQTWGHDQIVIDIENNTSKYYLISPAFIGCADIEKLLEEDAEKLLKSSQRIKTGHISNCERVGVPFDEAKKAICSK